MNAKQKEFIEKFSFLFFSFFGVSESVADFIACQFALESNFGDSDLVKKQNNFIGMKVPKKRITTSMPVSDNAFAYYSNAMLCVVDYFLWLSWNDFEQSALNDLDVFKAKIAACAYCPEPDYITKITNLLNSYKNGQKSSNN